MQLVAAVTCPLRRLLLTGRVGHPRRHLIRDLSLGSGEEEIRASVMSRYSSSTSRALAV